MREFLAKELNDVTRFHMRVTGMPIPDEPTMLAADGRDRAIKHLDEELTEFKDATTIADQADALVDLIYVAHGRLLQMGISPGPAFDLVHDANMAKVSGANKRGNTFEAAKPEGWRPPDWGAHLNIEAHHNRDRGQYIGLARGGRQNPFDNSCLPKPRILLLGYGRHGKDTVAEMLRDRYGFSFTSSSMFCAEKIMWPLMLDMRRAWFEAAALAPEAKSLGAPCPHYETPQECFDDRHNHRATWFKGIEAFNTPDKASLGRAIFAEHDIYCGLRSAREFNAVKNSGLYDVCIWVDRSQHVPPEGPESCTVAPWMADHVLDNNGSLEELAFNLKQLMEGSIDIA